MKVNLFFGTSFISLNNLLTIEFHALGAVIDKDIDLCTPGLSAEKSA